MEKDLFTELRESARKAIEEKGKPDYWDKLVEFMRSSAKNGHYCLELQGRLYNDQEPSDSSAKLLKDIIKNQELYAANLRENTLEMEITTQVNLLPSSQFIDRGHYFTEVHLKIDWSNGNE